MGTSLINLLKIDEYCSAEVADISSNTNSLLTMHSNNPLHEYPIKYNNNYINILIYIILYSDKFDR